MLTCSTHEQSVKIKAKLASAVIEIMLARFTFLLLLKCISLILRESIKTVKNDNIVLIAKSHILSPTIY